MKSRLKIDYEAGYTIKQAIQRSVAMDPITQRDIRTMESKGWRVSGKMRKTLEAANDPAEILTKKCL